MSIQQFRFLYRVMLGLVDYHEHYKGMVSLTSRACRNAGWLTEPQDSSPAGFAAMAVTDEGLAAMRAALPEVFPDLAFPDTVTQEEGTTP